MGRKKNIKSNIDVGARGPALLQSGGHPLDGAKIVDKQDQEVTVTDLKKKIIGIYFSAHWCPPCQEFTPLLAQRYRDIISKDQGFDIVFVSNDHDEAQCKQYYSAQHPWKLLAYKDRTSKKKLMRMFNITSIPTLVLVAEDGHVITMDGENIIMNTSFEKIKAKSEKKSFRCLVS